MAKNTSSTHDKKQDRIKSDQFDKDFKKSPHLIPVDTQANGTGSAYSKGIVERE